MSDLQKWKIIEEAYVLFTQRGYSDTTIRTISEKCGISHTKLIYHFKSKGNLAGDICERYIHNLLKCVKRIAAENDAANSDFYRMIWWTLHFLVITTQRDFGKFYIEYLTDDIDCFIDKISCYFPEVFGDMFDLGQNLNNRRFMNDMYILTINDYALSKLVFNKRMKVREAISKFLDLNMVEGLQKQISAEDVEEFISKYNLLEHAEKFKIIF